MKTLFVFPLMLLAACSNATTTGPANSSDGALTATENVIRSLDEKGILPALFPDGNFEGQAFAWKGSEYGGHIAIDTIMRFQQGGMNKAAVVMSHYTWEDGQRQTARLFLNGLSCAVLTQEGTGSWQPAAFRQNIMSINADPWAMMPKIERNGKDAWILRVASVVDLAGMGEEQVDVAYMDVKDLERVLSTTVGEQAVFLPSDQDRYDVEIRRAKGKVRMIWSATDRKYAPSGTARMR